VNASRVCQRANPSVGNSENVVPLVRDSNSVSEPPVERGEVVGFFRATQFLGQDLGVGLTEDAGKAATGNPKLGSAMIPWFGQASIAAGPGDAFWVCYPKNEDG
jgi:hypothetical protein